MGGGSKRRSNNGENKAKNSKRNSRPNTKSSSSSSARRRNSSLFVEGGILSDYRLDSWRATPVRGGSSSGKASKFGKLDRTKGSASPIKTKGSASTCGLRNGDGNAFSYQYPSLKIQGGVDSQSPVLGNDGNYKVDESNRIVLIDSEESKVVAYVDQKPSLKSQAVCYSYEYDPTFVLGDGPHRGLGFCDVSDESPSGIASPSKQIEKQEGSSSDSLSHDCDMDAEEEAVCGTDVDVADEVPSEKLSSRRNSGFLSIGGLKLYTEDISDEESNGDGDVESVKDKSSESSEPGESPESSYSDSASDMFDSDSDVDEEVAQDYLEGIGGSDNILKSKWLAEEAFDVSDDDSSSSSSFADTLKKLSGIALQETSRGYGMKSRSNNRVFGDSKTAEFSALDDLMLVKDPRSLSKKKKKQTARFPQSWPSVAQKSLASRRFPGEKKKHHKDMIAVKRRGRMLRRGIDLWQINSKLEQLVLDGMDMHCFPPMHCRDCSQVRRLAAIYRLSSSYQGSGKKRCVAVTRTYQTCMPSANNKLRLAKLIGAGDEDADFAVNEGLQAPNRSKSKKIAKRSGMDVLQSSCKSKSSRRSRSEKKGSYADQPVSFVSSGTIHSETVEVHKMEDKDAKEANGTKGVSISAQVGAFEVHTKGFGSKMMAKMGFVGGGLGKEGQGLAEPIQVTQRPKSLGLGLEFSNTASDLSSERTKPKTVRAFEKQAKEASFTGAELGSAKGFGAFEQHTKGFGLKMMAKMGFVGGLGLGRDSQGMVNPLVAVRRPKARGLGAKV